MDIHYRTRLCDVPRVRLFASCARGTEEPLVEELRVLGAASVEARAAGAAFEGDLEVAYRACLWSRVASRVLLPISSFECADEDALYDGVRAIDWSRHLAPDGTLACGFTQIRSPIAHTQFGALKTKDAIVDQFREKLGRRPSVEVERPDVRVHVHLEESRAEVAIDLSGEALHRRGWRTGAGEAPLKENLAAAILMLAGWSRERPLVDPFCGSGTFLVEAALMAADAAPGLSRDYFGFVRWRGHDAALWRRLTDEARQRRTNVRAEIFGFDADRAAVALAKKHARAAGVEIAVEVRSLEELAPPVENPGLVVTNPPWGERLGDKHALVGLYRLLGDLLKRRMTGWTAHVLAGDLELAKHIGLRAARRHVLFNGPIECRLLTIPISTEKVRDQPRALGRTPGAAAFENRLTKNFRHTQKWAEREKISCYRVYDADLPEYAVAVDRYEDAAHIAEYDPPKTVDPHKAEARLADAIAVVPSVLGIDARDVFVKVRRRGRAHEQYGKLAATKKERIVGEGGHRFLVNLSDYLDTGLYLDHRRVRALVGELARGRRFLSLFSYTGTATVYAARGGALSTTSVDLSNTYLDWARRNFELNGVRGPSHELLREDVLKFLARPSRRRYGLILMTPPTYSTSKKMSDTLDVQRDHAELIRAAAALLEPDGVLLFSNHFRKFKMDREALAGFSIEEITNKTVPKDFARTPRIHNCWKIGLTNSKIG